LNRFVLLPGTGEAIRLLNQNGFLAIVVSNQSGVARGYFPVELVERVHKYMSALLEKEQAFVDGIFFCPHHPRGEVLAYRKECPCRKPMAGLIDQACQDFEIDLNHSFVIGDRSVDLEMAEKVNLKSILVKTGYGRGELDYILPQKPYKPSYIGENLLDSVKWIIEQRPGAA
jgi:D-glycero-D-manno-heptose 1,7-bisphosphate phosphatase